MDVNCLDEWMSMLLGSLRLSVRASRLCPQTLGRLIHPVEDGGGHAYQHGSLPGRV